MVFIFIFFGNFPFDFLSFYNATCTLDKDGRDERGWHVEMVFKNLAPAESYYYSFDSLRVVVQV